MTIAALLTGDYSALAHGRVSSDASAQIRWALLQNVRRHSGAMAAANMFNACVLASALWSTDLRDVSLLWSALLAVWVLVFALGRRSPSIKSETGRASSRAINRAIRNAVMLGALWGALPILMFSRALPQGQVLIACLCAGMMGGGAFALTTIPVAAIGFIAPVALGSIIALARDGGESAAPVVCLITAYFSMLALAVFDNAKDAVKRAVARLEIQRLSMRDGLTDLGNQNGLREEIDHAMLRLRAGGEPCALMCLDILRMSDVNKAHGYAAGDELLCQAAERLKKVVLPNDVVARVSGDHFAVLARGLSGEATIQAYANRLLTILTEPYRLTNGAARIGAVAGIAVAREGGDMNGDLFGSANFAVSAAKRQGAGAIVLFSPQDDAARQRRDALDLDLRRALKDNLLRLRYDPILDIASNKIVGFEAVVKWPHSIHGDVPDTEVLQIAEDRGLIEALGHWVLREACVAAAAWPADARISVTMSPSQLGSSALPSQVAAALSESGLASGRLEIKVSQSGLSYDQNLVAHVLTTLRESGVRVALDGLGVGYSSLNYLRRLPFHRIKMDQVLIQDTPADPTAAAIVKMIVALADELGMQSAAGGVANEAQLAFLRGAGVSQAQGSLVADAMPDEKIGEFLAARALAGPWPRLAASA